MSDAKLLAACKAQHEALDTLFAMLLARNRLSDAEPFYPSKSGQPWEAVVQGNRAIAAAEACKLLLEIPFLDPKRVGAVADAANPHGVGSWSWLVFGNAPQVVDVPPGMRIRLRITLEPYLSELDE